MKTEQFKANGGFLLLSQFPILQKILPQINQAGIRYGLYSGALVASLNPDRRATDVDLLIADQDWDKLVTIFPQAQVQMGGKYGNGHFLFLDDRQIELVTRADIEIADRVYPFRLTELVWQHTFVLAESGIRACNIVDTILLKAMLQRDVDQGKHDPSDIASLLKAQSINQDYFRQRAVEVQADQRIFDFLAKLQVVNDSMSCHE